MSADHRGTLKHSLRLACKSKKPRKGQVLTVVRIARRRPQGPLKLYQRETLLAAAKTIGEAAFAFAKKTLDLQDDSTSFSDNKADDLSAPSQSKSYDTGPSGGGVLKYDPNFSDAQFLDFNDRLLDNRSIKQFSASLSKAERQAYNQRAGTLYNARAQARLTAVEGEESGALDGLQTTLDVGGLTPGVGIFADGANTLISAARGKWTEAGFNLFAMVPVFGQGCPSRKSDPRGLTRKLRVATRI